MKIKQNGITPAHHQFTQYVITETLHESLYNIRTAHDLEIVEISRQIDDLQRQLTDAKVQVVFLTRVSQSNHLQIQSTHEEDINRFKLQHREVELELAAAKCDLEECVASFTPHLL